MPSLGTDVLVVERDSPNVESAVEELFSKARTVRFNSPVESHPDLVREFGNFEFVDVGKVQCSYAVAGAWNVAAKCEVVSDDGDTKAWMGWVFDYTPHGSDEGTDAPARFSFCFDPELYRSKKLVVDFPDIDKKFRSAVKSASSKYVCVEGWVDNPDYFAARSKKSMEKIASVVDKSLSEIGLYGGRR